MQILLVEDDAMTASALTEALTDHHYLVSHAADGQVAYEMAQSFLYDLILMDVMLPKLDGISLCRQLRTGGCQIPILLLTAKDTSTDRVMGLDAGADDYMVKPFDLPELMARIRALVRRNSTTRSPILSWGDLLLNPGSGEVIYQGQLLHLTPKEYGLLELFLSNPKQAFSRSMILDRLWSIDDSPGEETVTTHIKGLRHKLKQVGVPDLIETVYGLGYRLKPPPDLKPVAPTLSPPISVGSKAARQQKVLQSLQKIWARSQPHLQSQLQLLEQAQQALQQDQITPELQEQARQEAHRLAGSVGIFGFTQGSALAHQVELLLARDLGIADAPELHQLVTALKQELAQPHQPAAALLPPAQTRPSFLLISSDTQLSQNIQLAATQSGFHAKIQTTLVIDCPEWTTHPPDIVLLDLTGVTPLTKRLEFLEALLRQQPELPILVLTDHDDLTERVQVARLGIRAYLPKPIATSAIIQTVTQALQNHFDSQPRIMVVDDDPQVIAALQVILNAWGLQVIALQDPRQFWQVLTSTAPDLLVLDVEMPDFSGIDLCRVVRNDPTWGNLPIVILTVHTDAATIHQMFAAGADDYITKPVIGPELVTRILSRIERIKGFRALSAPSFPRSNPE